MAKKKGRYEPIDEDMIRNLIGGVDAPPRLVPKQVPVAVPQEAAPPETPPPEAMAVPPIEDSGRKGHSIRGTNTSYEQLFLTPRAYRAQNSCRIDCETWKKLNLIVHFLGGKQISVPGLIHNIIMEHLATYRDEINSKLNQLTKTI